jgi:glycosyltransferase involved in cell wall biosynthesis
VAWRFFGVPKNKIEVVHLGSDSRYFHPVLSDKEAETREQLRASFGFSSSDVVCIFTGKMDSVRNPLLLCQAIIELRKKNKPFQALFIGAGPQRTEIEAQGFAVLDFMPFRELGNYYRACEIGVWPGPESISQLDAAGCGLPLVVGDAAHYRDHVEGNGIVYKTGCKDALVDALSELENHDLRLKLGALGVQKIDRSFSWRSIAERRIGDYSAALSGR